MTEQQTAWVPRDERRVSPTPTEIPPHPDHGDLPPCEHGIARGEYCPRPATTHYGYVYHCDEHLEAVYASEDYDNLGLALHHAKRMLWKAQVEGVDRLEYHVGNALSELEGEYREAEKKMNAAYEKADGGRRRRVS